MRSLSRELTHVRLSRFRFTITLSTGADEQNQVANIYSHGDICN